MWGHVRAASDAWGDCSWASPSSVDFFCLGLICEGSRTRSYLTLNGSQCHGDVDIISGSLSQWCDSGLHVHLWRWNDTSLMMILQICGVAESRHLRCCDAATLHPRCGRSVAVVVVLLLLLVVAVPNVALYRCV